MTSFFIFLFEPNPGYAFYTSGRALVLLWTCIALFAAAFVVRTLRGRSRDAIFKKLSRSWSTALLWFACTGVFLVVARVEEMPFLAMRFWWGMWLVALIGFVCIQFRLFRARYYKKIVAKERPKDPRKKYLPGKKR